MYMKNLINKYNDCILKYNLAFTPIWLNERFDHTYKNPFKATSASVKPSAAPHTLVFTLTACEGLQPSLI